MNNEIRNILVLNHSGHPGGATISLINLLDGLKKREPELKFDVVHLDNGMRVKEFDIYSDNIYFPVEKHKFCILLNRLLSKFDGRNRCNVEFPCEVRERITSRTYDCIFANTAVCLPILSDLNSPSIPTYCWVHELEKYCYNLFGNDLRRLLTLPINYVACSQAVDDFLKHVNVSRSSLILSECISSDYFIHNDVANKMETTSLKVAMIGTVDLRKGYDLFLSVVKSLRTHSTTVQFRWVGYDSGDATADFQSRIINEKLSTFIELVPYSNSSLEALQDIDVLLLTSREDPNPLVVIEALAVGIVPIVQLGSGGAVDHALNSGGIVVDYESTEDMANAILQLAKDFEDLNIRKQACIEYANQHLHPDAVVKSFLALVSTKCQATRNLTPLSHNY
jgi:glycosyltransferase involved in cell wall biosynthesis